MAICLMVGFDDYAVNMTDESFILPQRDQRNLAVAQLRHRLCCASQNGLSDIFGHFLLFIDYDTTANNTSPVKF